MLIVWIGEKLVNFLVEPKKGTKWPKKLPRFKDRTEATAVCKELCNLQYLLRCEKVGKGELTVRRTNLRYFPKLSYRVLTIECPEDDEKSRV